MAGSKGTERSLVLVRHGQSLGNLRNEFTGWIDIGLSPQGAAEAEATGHRLQAMGHRFDVVYTSALRRASATAAIICKVLGQEGVETHSHAALNERDYGDLSGLNKDEARERWGADQVLVWRRSYDIAPPHGESLKDTIARVVPYYVTAILPGVMRGARTLVVAHGNSLRALVMVLDHHTPETIPAVEFATGEIARYQLASDTTASRQTSA